MSHIATDGQSVCLSWCRAPSGAHDQILVTVWQCLFCPWGAPSLTRGWVCLLSECVSSNTSIVRTYSYIHFTYFTWYDTHIQYIQDLCQSGVSTADYALFLVRANRFSLFSAFAWSGPHRKHSFPYIVATFLTGVFTGCRIRTAVLLLLPVFVAARMFTDIPLLFYRIGLYITIINVIWISDKVTRQQWNTVILSISLKETNFWMWGWTRIGVVEPLSEPIQRTSR
jgi:hypothetical protein